MYLTLNAPDLARPLFRALSTHLSIGLERRWRLPSRRGGAGLPEAVWERVLAMETEERRQRRLHPVSPLEQEAIHALRNRQWDGLLQLFDRRKVSGVLVWNGYRGRRGLLTLAAQHVGLPVVQFERCAFPGYLQAGLGGTNAGSAHLSGHAFQSTKADPAITDWFLEIQRQRPPRSLLGRILTRGRTEQANDTTESGLLPARFIYCPLQVAADTQLTVHGGWVPDMLAYIRAVTTAALTTLPHDISVVFRPHPSCAVGQREALNEALMQARNAALASGLQGDTAGRIRVETAGSSATLLARCESVVTVNSSVGLEAFAYGKPVITLGRSFYGGRDLTLEAGDQVALNTALSDPNKVGFDAAAREQYLTWLRTSGFHRWPSGAGDPAAAALAAHVGTLMRAAAGDGPA